MNDDTKLRMAFLICATITSIVALIGGFWGAEGFRTLGIWIGVVIVLTMFIIAMITER